MKYTHSVSLGLLLLSCSFNSHALLTSGTGARVGMSTYTNCPSFCYGSSGTFASDGGADSLFSSAAIGTDARAQATYLGELLTPNLKVYSSTNSVARASSSATVIQSYNYLGTSAANFTVNFSLHGILSDINSDDYLSSFLGVVKATENIEFYASAATYFAEIVPYTPGAEIIDFKSLILDEASTTDTLTDSISFMLNPNESIYLFSDLRSYSNGGGVVDGFNTLTTSITSDTVAALSSLSPVATPSAVPVPAAVWLLGSGLMAIFGFRKRDGKKI